MQDLQRVASLAPKGGLSGTRARFSEWEGRGEKKGKGRKKKRKKEKKKKGEKGELKDENKKASWYTRPSHLPELLSPLARLISLYSWVHGRTNSLPCLQDIKKYGEMTTNRLMKSKLKVL